MIYRRPYTTGRVVFVGSGGTVANVQRTLKREGYYHGAIDGIIGPETRSAIRAFQGSHGLRVTGHLDASLLRAL